MKSDDDGDENGDNDGGEVDGGRWRVEGIGVVYFTVHTLMFEKKKTHTHNKTISNLHI